jgi:hypothetical protein
MFSILQGMHGLLAALDVTGVGSGAVKHNLGLTSVLLHPLNPDACGSTLYCCCNTENHCAQHTM